MPEKCVFEFLVCFHVFSTDAMHYVGLSATMSGSARLRLSFIFLDIINTMETAKNEKFFVIFEFFFGWVVLGCGRNPYREGSEPQFYYH